jgi:hypothetical protein
MHHLLVRACEVIAQESYVPFEEALEKLADMEVVPFIVRNECRCVALLRGTEIHLVIFPAWRHRCLSRRRIRAFLAPLFNRLGFLTTRVQLTSTDNIVFVERIGFQRTWSDGIFAFFMMTQLPYGGTLQ